MLHPPPHRGLTCPSAGDGISTYCDISALKGQCYLYRPMLLSFLGRGLVLFWRSWPLQHSVPLLICSPCGCRTLLSGESNPREHSVLQLGYRLGWVHIWGQDFVFCWKNVFFEAEVFLRSRLISLKNNQLYNFRINWGEIRLEKGGEKRLFLHSISLDFIRKSVGVGFPMCLETSDHEL